MLYANTLSNVEEMNFEVNGLSLAAKVHGPEDGHPILALHGWMDNAASFDVLAPLLVNARVVALDMAGHGNSSHRPGGGPYHIWDNVAEVIAIADQLGWRQFSLIGHSLGSGVASLVASAYAERVKHLVFIDGMGPPFTSSIQEVAVKFSKVTRHINMAKRTQLFGFCESGEAVFDTYEMAVKNRMKGFAGGELGIEAARLIVERALRKAGQGFRYSTDPCLTLPSPVQLSEEHVAAFYSLITAEVHIFHGKTGLFANGENEHRLAFLKNVRTPVILPGGHHLHMEESAEAIASLINQLFTI